jgi:CheY-like chemotaxis protein
VATPKALIIDDNSIVRHTIVTLVQELGFIAIGAPSAESARALLGNDEFDVLLCDENLGAGLTGTQFMSTDPASLPAILVLMSGEARPPGLPTNVRYLDKPFTITQLEEALRLES